MNYSHLNPGGLGWLIFVLLVWFGVVFSIYDKIEFAKGGLDE